MSVTRGVILRQCPGLLVPVGVGHVQHADHGVAGGLLGRLVGVHQCWSVLVAVLAVCHGGDGEVWLDVVGGHVQVELVSLVDYVVVILGLVVIPGRVIIIPNMIGILVLGTVRPPHPLPVDALQDVLVGLGLVRLVVLCILQENLIHVC